MTEKTGNGSVSLKSNLRLLGDSDFQSVMFIGFVAGLGINVASAALPSVTQALAVSDSTAGWIVTAYTLPAMVMVPVTGILSDLYGRRVVVLPSLLLFGLAGTGIAFVDSFRVLLVLRAVQGIAVAGIMPLTVTLLGDLYSGTKGSTAQGLRVASLGAFSISIPIIVGYISGFSWNYPFLLYLLSIPAMVFVYFFLPETSPDTKRQASILETLRGYARNLAVEIKNVDTALLISGGFARDFVRYTLMTFIPLYAVRSLGASFVVAGTILSVRGIAQIILSPLSGVIAGHLSRKGALLAAIALGAVSTFLMSLAPSPLWLGLIFGVYAMGDALFSPVIKDLVTDQASDERRAGVVSGMKVLNYAGQSTGPAFFGVILALFGFGALFTTAAAVAGIYGLLILTLLTDDL